MSEHSIVVGPGGDYDPTELPPKRRDILDLVNDKYQFSLYIQALKAVQAEPYSDDFSFVSIGGIHGQPYIPWGDSKGMQPVKSEFRGYCTHGSVLFPTWHRIYVLLFEEALWTQAQKIAGEYTTEVTKWKNAALSLRSPYWDWARPPVQPGSLSEGRFHPPPLSLKDWDVPEVLVSSMITITTPKGEETISNPLYTYNFQGEFPVDTFREPWKLWHKTLRYPSSQDSHAESRMHCFDKDYKEHKYQLAKDTYLCLLFNNKWDSFSNHTAAQTKPEVNSLETIHDGVHDMIGGENSRGHMSNPNVAAFDPIFWLHHTNVDRILALWQAIHSQEWVSEGTQPGGTYTINTDGKVNVKSDLTPFWNTQTSYWKSTEVRAFTELKYTYPEFENLRGGNPLVAQGEILRKVHELYGDGSIFNRPRRHPDDEIRTWSLRIRFKKYELKSSFSIRVLLEGAFVGSVSAFVNPDPEQCANCQDNLDTEIEGFVHLTETLLEKYPSLPSLEPHDVFPHLGKLSISLRGRKADGSLADIDNDLPSLKVLPYTQTLITTRDGGLPRLGQAHYYTDVLQGRHGHTPFERWLVPDGPN